MKHPLVNPSLTPHGLGTGNTYSRSKTKNFGDGCCNGDWCAARYWQEVNRLDSDFRPAEHIVHEIMPGMKTIGHTSKGDFLFDGKPYMERDLAIMTSIAVWLGTNNGRAMLQNSLFRPPPYTKTNEYIIRWREREKPQLEGHMLCHLLHRCTPDTCAFGRAVGGCFKHYVEITVREQLVLDAFLFWLGQASGRTYLGGLEEFLSSTSKNIWEGYAATDPKLRML